LKKFSSICLELGYSTPGCGGSSAIMFLGFTLEWYMILTIQSTVHHIHHVLVALTIADCTSIARSNPRAGNPNNDSNNFLETANDRS